MTAQNIPVETLPFLYISGMNLSVASTLSIAIAPGQARDSNDVLDIAYAVPFYINSSIVGAGGLDVSTLAASSNYGIWAIADSSNKHPNSAILSLWSNVFPTMPFGYDSYRLIGMVSTSAGTVFTAASILNASSAKGFFLQPPVSVLSGGNATTFTAINLSTPIPTTTAPFVSVQATATFIPSVAGDTLQFRPTGSTATTNLVTITGVTAGVAQTSNIVLHAGVSGGLPSIDYKVTASGDSASLSVMGYYSTLS